MSGSLRDANPDGTRGNLSLPGKELDPWPIQPHGDHWFSGLHPVDPSPGSPFGDDLQIPYDSLDPSPVHPHGGDLSFPGEWLDPSPLRPHGGDDWFSTPHAVDPDPNFSFGLAVPHKELDPSPIHSHGNDEPDFPHPIDPKPVPEFSSDPLDILMGSHPIHPGVVKTPAGMGGDHPGLSDSDGGGAAGSPNAPASDALDPAAGQFRGSAAIGDDNSNSNDDPAALGAGHIGNLGSSASQVLEDSIQNQGSDRGILVIGGHDAVANTGSFWDHAAEAPQGMTAGLPSPLLAVGEIDALDHAVPNEILLHDAISGGLGGDDHPADHLAMQPFAAAREVMTVGSDNVEPGATALHEMLSLSSGTFAHQVHI